MTVSSNLLKLLASKTEESLRDWASAHHGACFSPGDVGYCEPESASWTAEVLTPAHFKNAFTSPKEARDWLDREIKMSNEDGNDRGWEALLVEDIQEEIYCLLVDGQAHIWDGWHRAAACVATDRPIIAIVGRPLPEPSLSMVEKFVATTGTANESAMQHLLTPKGESQLIGAETGRAVKDGIAHFASPTGSHRFVFFEKGSALAALQVMSRDGKSGEAANVFTDPSARRRGLASQLFAAAHQVFELALSPDRSPDGAALLNGMEGKKQPSSSVSSKFPKEYDTFDWSKRVGDPVIALPFEEGLPSKEKAKAFSAWVRVNSDLYKNKYVKLYHATDPSLDIESEGLKPTSATRRRSFQSSSGFVYLANTPERAKAFGDLGNQGRSTVYEVVVPVRKLLADKDQLSNQRDAFRDRDETVGDSIGESIIYGGGVRVKGAIEPWAIRKMTLLDNEATVKKKGVKP